MRLYHGTDQWLLSLKPGTYVTRRKKDAWKFGYRKAIMNNSDTVSVYQIVGDPKVTPDPNRDGAYILLEEAKVDQFNKDTRFVYDAPYKLTRFEMERIIQSEDPY